MFSTTNNISKVPYNGQVIEVNGFTSEESKAVVPMSKGQTFVLVPDQATMRTINNQVSDGTFAVIDRIYQYIMTNSIAREKLQSNCLSGFFVGAFVVWVLISGPPPRQIQSAPNTDQTNSTNEPSSNHRQQTVAISQDGAFIKKLGITLLGGVCTSAVSFFWTTRSIVFSTDYALWRYEAIMNGIFANYKNFLKTSELEQFTCPITKDFPTIAVKDPQEKNVWYEFSEIKQWISTAERNREEAIKREPTESLREAKRAKLKNTTSPLGNRDLKVEDLQFDFNYYIEVGKIIAEHLKRKLDTQYRAGLLSYQLTINQNREQLLKATKDEVFKKMEEGVIPREDFFTILDACNSFYGGKPVVTESSQTVKA